MYPFLLKSHECHLQCVFGSQNIDAMIYMQASRVASAALSLYSARSNASGANAIDLEELHVSVSR